jgi:hypothetical protein
MAEKLKTMATSPLSVVLQHLLADLRPDGGGMTDGELLTRFLSSRDEDRIKARLKATARARERSTPAWKGKNARP